jgi:hypothetical protein
MKLAKEHEQNVRDWMGQAGSYFLPIPAIPQGNVTSKTYATALGTTIYQLRQEAGDKSVNIPPDYNFSFQVQSSKLTISSGLGPLAEQLGEVKAISEILFAARVNDLEGIQRVRVSDDDAQGSPADYIDERPVTNDLAIITPYVVTFRTFTPELASVIVGFATSPNAFIVKLVSVQPAAGAAGQPGMPGQYPGQPGQYPGQPGMPGQYHGQNGMPGQYPGQPVPGYGQPGGMPVPEQAGRGGLQTVLKEQLLSITLEVEIVKLLPKS